MSKPYSDKDLTPCTACGKSDATGYIEHLPRTNIYNIVCHGCLKTVSSVKSLEDVIKKWKRKTRGNKNE